MCDGTIVDYFPVDTRVRQGCVRALTLLNTCMDHVLERVSEKSGCGVWLGTVLITDLDLVTNMSAWLYVYWPGTQGG